LPTTITLACGIFLISGRFGESRLKIAHDDPALATAVNAKAA